MLTAILSNPFFSLGIEAQIEVFEGLFAKVSLPRGYNVHASNDLKLIMKKKYIRLPDLL